MLQAEQILQERYQLKQQLGKNTGRQTWLATDLQAAKPESVIVKLLAFSPQMQWEELKLFEREAQVLKNLNHPRIPCYRDYFSIDEQAGGGLPWFGLVQNYIPGSSLRQLLDQGKRFTEAQVRYVANDILEILIYLHELSPAVLHRDIKPSNIILGKDRQFYLVDFGAVQDRGKAEGATFTVVGTSGYAPPEQLWGRAVPASDLYALGATLVHLLTSIPPADLPQQSLRIQFSDKVNLNPDFTSWIEQLINPAPERRFNTARLALEALKLASPDNQTETRRQALGASANSDSKIRYGRLALLASLQLLVFAALMGALPNLVFGDRYKTKQSEAKQYVGSMNRAQQAYFIENNTFSDSIGKLELGIPIQTSNYSYSTRSDSKGVVNYGISQKDNLRSYVGGVFVVPTSTIKGEKIAIKGKNITVGILCEAEPKGQFQPSAPIFDKGLLNCAPGTTEINRY